ncbi:MAG: hypothetical protein IIC00_14345 [Planctomycetes bacterium]|nr:hypothetical protein [Planctomycetota bacterium]
MGTQKKLAYESTEPLKTTIKRFCIVVIFSIAFAYIEAAVVVYLRTIFPSDGFSFPLTDFGTILQQKPLRFTEMGREAATIVLIFTGVWLFGRNRRQRFAYFLTIFAIWDIFYYVWLKVLIDWPASIMDWDILFLIPAPWASAVLYPVLISITMLIFAAAILYRDARGRPIKVTRADWLVFIIAAVIVVVSFYIPGRHITEPDYKSYFYWPLFALGHISAIAVFLKCLLKSKSLSE